ncbi:MAG: SMC-Scp complex subunit ScpB [Pseudomonadota bacterium]
MTRPQPIANDAETEESVTEVAEEAMPETNDVVTMHPRADRSHHLRIVEALLFAASEPLSTEQLTAALPEGADLASLLEDLQANYANRGVNLVQVAGRWALRTASDLSFLLRREAVEQKRLSKAALETLAIIAYHQPVTRAEIEEIRGVAISKGTLDTLLEIGWTRMRGRRRTPGRPVTYGTTPAFLAHFGLNEIGDLPGLQELRGAGLLDTTMPPGFDMPVPKMSDELTPDEDPLDGTEESPLEMHLPEEDEVVSEFEAEAALPEPLDAEVDDNGPGDAAPADDTGADEPKPEEPNS